MEEITVAMKSFSNGKTLFLNKGVYKYDHELESIVIFVKSYLHFFFYHEFNARTIISS
jgi:hypothetical protein